MLSSNSEGMRFLYNLTMLRTRWGCGEARQGECHGGRAEYRVYTPGAFCGPIGPGRDIAGCFWFTAALCPGRGCYRARGPLPVAAGYPSPGGIVIETKPAGR